VTVSMTRHPAARLERQVLRCGIGGRPSPRLAQ
jgi:hypothetical protein